jgi:hypothetical protein
MYKNAKIVSTATWFSVCLFVNLNIGIAFSIIEAPMFEHSAFKIPDGRVNF